MDQLELLEARMFKSSIEGIAVIDPRADEGVVSLGQKWLDFSQES